MAAADRRAALLDVGRTLFAERGFDGTSVEEIAARAGVSKPVVYEHFGGKDGLYAVVVDREVAALLERFTAALTGGHAAAAAGAGHAGPARLRRGAHATASASWCASRRCPAARAGRPS